MSEIESMQQVDGVDLPTTQILVMRVTERHCCDNITLAALAHVHC